jgi:DNA-directed RNA polymerase subunit RPC12/RpoP
MATLPVRPAAEFTGVRKLGGICTHCGSEEIFRQRPLGLIERHLLRALRFVPYWCATCNTRFYLRVRTSPVLPHD